MSDGAKWFVLGLDRALSPDDSSWSGIRRGTLCGDLRRDGMDVMEKPSTLTPAQREALIPKLEERERELGAWMQAAFVAGWLQAKGIDDEPFDQSYSSRFNRYFDEHREARDAFTKLWGKPVEQIRIHVCATKLKR